MAVVSNLCAIRSSMQMTLRQIEHHRSQRNLALTQMENLSASHFTITTMVLRSVARFTCRDLVKAERLLRAFRERFSFSQKNGAGIFATRCLQMALSQPVR